MKLEKICYLALGASLLSPISANADFLSVTVGGGVWNETPSGNFQKTTDPAEVNLKDNFFWDSESQGYAFAKFEHFVPIVPNVRLMYTKLDHSGSGNTAFTFDGQSFGGLVSNDFKIETLDLLAYWEVLDNVVSLDIGINVRNLKADYTIINGTAVTDSVNETVPMLYALVGGSPWPDLIISGEMSYIAFSGSTISDFTAKVAYTTNFFVGFEAGYRKQKFEFDDVAETNAKMDFDGIFAGAYLKF